MQIGILPTSFQSSHYQLCKISRYLDTDASSLSKYYLDELRFKVDGTCLLNRERNGMIFESSCKSLWIIEACPWKLKEFMFPKTPAVKECSLFIATVKLYYGLHAWRITNISFCLFVRPLHVPVNNLLITNSIRTVLRRCLTTTPTRWVIHTVDLSLVRQFLCGLL